jgi:8-oxo-dGTP pyrophosphatase MutT (NUDIX family)
VSEVPESIEAATVVVLRDGPDGIETLLLRRNSRLGFGGGAWVFPGGRVDPEDRRPGDDDVAAARRAAVREAAEEAGLVVDEAELVPFSHWTPPDVQVKRFATWFFLAPVEETVVSIDGGEIVDHLWVTPADALGSHAAGEVELLPPTWVTLDLIGRHTDVASALEHARTRPIDVHVTKIVQDGEGRTYSMWEGDAGYDAGDASLPGDRHRLQISGTPWRYERDHD